MSFEGKEVRVCENNHLTVSGPTSHFMDGWWRCYCGSKELCFGFVDETNGEPFKYNFLLMDSSVRLPVDFFEKENFSDGSFKMKKLDGFYSKNDTESPVPVGI